MKSGIPLSVWIVMLHTCKLNLIFFFLHHFENDRQHIEWVSFKAFACQHDHTATKTGHHVVHSDKHVHYTLNFHVRNFGTFIIQFAFVLYALWKLFYTKKETERMFYGQHHRRQQQNKEITMQKRKTGDGGISTVFWQLLFQNTFTQFQFQFQFRCTHTHEKKAKWRQTHLKMICALKWELNDDDFVDRQIRRNKDAQHPAKPDDFHLIDIQVEKSWISLFFTPKKSHTHWCRRDNYVSCVMRREPFQIDIVEQTWKWSWKQPNIERVKNLNDFRFNTHNLQEEDLTLCLKRHRRLFAEKSWKI